MTVTDPAQTNTSVEGSAIKSVRLHYLDWLQVLELLGVFLFHAIHPFDDLADWHIKNAEKSALATFFVGFFNLWGMPFSFLMAGATSWFSLRRRTPGRYIRERVTRLLIPFIIGSIVLTPIQAYYELTHKGWWQGGSIVEFILSPEARTYFYTEYNSITISPQILGEVGYHLWFLGFLFAYALLALPVFLWLNQDSGKRSVTSLARLAKWRGGLLVFLIPLILIRFILHQPVIIAIAFYVVQWDTGITVKWLVVVLASLLVTLGLAELVIKRFSVLRGLFGMKTRRWNVPSTAR